MPSPLVAVIMALKSDWETMAHATAVLDDNGVPYEKHIVSGDHTAPWSTECSLGIVACSVGVAVAVAVSVPVAVAVAVSVTGAEAVAVAVDV